MTTESLNNGVVIHQYEDSFRFGTDSVLLAWFAAQKKNKRACDLCTGSGIVPLLLSSYQPSVRCVGVEIEERVASLATRSVRDSGREDTVEILCRDLREYRDFPFLHTVDLVTVNPPYLTAGVGIDPQKQRTARQETLCTLEDVLDAAKAILCENGRLCVVLRADRTAELFSLMRERKIEPKRALFVQPTAAKAPYLVLCEGVSGGKAGIIIEKNLVLNTPEGKPSPELADIYRFVLAGERK